MPKHDAVVFTIDPLPRGRERTPGRTKGRDTKHGRGLQGSGQPHEPPVRPVGPGLMLRHRRGALVALSSRAERILLP